MEFLPTLEVNSEEREDLLLYALSVNVLPHVRLPKTQPAKQPESLQKLKGMMRVLHFSRETNLQQMYNTANF